MQAPHPCIRFRLGILTSATSGRFRLHRKKYAPYRRAVDLAEHLCHLYNRIKFPAIGNNAVVYTDENPWRIFSVSANIPPYENPIEVCCGLIYKTAGIYTVSVWWQRGAGSPSGTGRDADAVQALYKAIRSAGITINTDYYTRCTNFEEVVSDTVRAMPYDNFLYIEHLPGGLAS